MYICTCEKISLFDLKRSNKILFSGIYEGDISPGHVPPEPTSTGGLVPAKEMINFSNTVPGGQVFLVWEFRSGFEQSGTVMPPNWQELYERYVAAGESNRIEFLKRLSAGEYRERWGSF